MEWNTLACCIICCGFFLVLRHPDVVQPNSLLCLEIKLLSKFPFLNGFFFFNCISDSLSFSSYDIFPHLSCGLNYLVFHFESSFFVKETLLHCMAFMANHEITVFLSPLKLKVVVL